MSKFYPLNHQEWLDACNMLTASERDVLYYIRTLDPYSKGVKIDSSEIAENLGVHRTTVSRSLKTLDVKGFIDLEILMSNVVIKSKGALVHTDVHQCTTKEKDCAPVHTDVHQCTDLCTSAHGCAPVHKDTPKSGSGQASVFSKIDQDQLDQLNRSIDRDFVNFENSEKPELAQVANLLSSKIDDSKLVCNDELANVPTSSINPVDSDSFRRSVEDFILKSRNFAPRDRTAYFSRFSAENWQEWESKYKATLTQPSSMYKPFVPEQVVIASPDSPSVQDAIAEIRKSLGIKT